MIKKAIARVVEGKSLSEGEMSDAMAEIFAGRASPAQIGALLIALRMKGESLAEITGAAKAMRAAALPVPTKARSLGQSLVDIVGTGGDATGTFNVSTTTAFVVAGAGLPVAKHGNRAVSSSCGSADLIEALGIPLDIPPQLTGQCIDQVGIGFLFAPVLHRAMGNAIGPRREIGLRTIFNLLGPLTNPADANVLVVGVYDPGLCPLLAETLDRLGAECAYVIHGEGGYDEATVTGNTWISYMAGGSLCQSVVTPEDVGLCRAKGQDLRGGSPQSCKDFTLEILHGAPGPKRDMVLLNAACALKAAGQASDLKEGVALAAASIDTGAALAKLEALREMVQRNHCQDQEHAS
ncbi:MAG: anthranilate phosphoribosyltransferase [Desulfarculaceae bacterium]|jgi:anthranilate phosphoribosyltransferase